MILTGLTSLFLSLTSVYAEAIKTDLIIERDQIQTILTDPSPYNDLSIDAFNTDLNSLGGMVYIESVISDTLVEQTVVDQLTLDLQLIQTHLVTKLTYEETHLAYQTALSSDVSNYTPLSATDFYNELDRIEAILNNPRSGDNVLLALTTEIELSYDLLTLLADVTELETLNTLALLAYYEERLLYTEESHNLFKAAVQDYGTYLYVNNVISNLNVTQTEVDTLVVTIQNALDLLVERGDISSLQDQYDQLTMIDLTDFTPSSIALFQSKLLEIQAVILSPNTTQAIVNSAFQEALQANNLLINLANKQDLLDLIDSTKSLKASDYTLTSFGYLQSILDSTEAFILDLNVSQVEVDEFFEKLDEAIKLLRTKLSPIVLQAMRGSIDIKQYVVIGDTTIIGYYSSNPSIANVSSEGMVEGYDYGQVVIRVELANGLYEEIPVIVKAKIKTSTFIVVISLPVLSIGIAFVLLTTNVEPSKVIKRIRKVKQS